MTPEQLLSLVTELHALERLEAVLERRLLDAEVTSEWVFALAAIRERLSWCRYYRSLESAALVDDAERTLADNRRQTPLTAAPAPGRIH